MRRTNYAILRGVQYCEGGIAEVSLPQSYYKKIPFIITYACLNKMFFNFKVSFKYSLLYYCARFASFCAGLPIFLCYVRNSYFIYSRKRYLVILFSVETFSSEAKVGLQPRRMKSFRFVLMCFVHLS